MEKYTVLTYDFGGYEKVHEIKEKSPNAEYLYVTDNQDLQSDTWEIMYIDNPWPDDVFRLCYEVRFNPWNYVDTDIVVRVDGSIGIDRNLDELVQYFIDGDYDIGFPLHPLRDTMIHEYSAWVQLRQYPVDQANRCLAFMQKIGYDVVNFKGMGQYNVVIQKRNRINELINEGTMWALKTMAGPGKEIERIDQTVGNMIIQKFYPETKVMPMSVDLTDGLWMTWYGHNSDIKIPYADKRLEPFYHNQPVEFCPLTVKEKEESK